MSTTNLYTPSQLVRFINEPHPFSNITYTVMRTNGDDIYLSGVPYPTHFTNLRLATPEEAHEAKVIVTHRQRIRYVEDIVSVQYIPGHTSPSEETIVSTRDIESHCVNGFEHIVRVGLQQYPLIKE